MFTAPIATKAKLTDLWEKLIVLQRIGVPEKTTCPKGPTVLPNSFPGATQGINWSHYWRAQSSLLIPT